MRSHLTLEPDHDEYFAHGPAGYLAIVDLESYETFAGENTDRLDMMAHLQGQMRALTAVAWGAPLREVKLRVRVTEDDRVVAHSGYTPHTTTASGWVRTNGQLVLTSHDRLFDCAHHRAQDLFHGRRLPKLSRPRLLRVPPGIYAVLVYYHFPFPEWDGQPSEAWRERKIDYTVLLRRYPFPSPRVAPVRLSAGLIPWAGEENAALPWDGRAESRGA
ncbi:MAG TPA: hypothetical protein VL981_11820 [Candidatus Methylacidiphilales bacterium]|nr:hypothetical protein [Candidatus Methylacidiphilales bacterium]